MGDELPENQKRVLLALAMAAGAIGASTINIAAVCGLSVDDARAALYAVRDLGLIASGLPAEQPEPEPNPEAN